MNRKPAYLIALISWLFFPAEDSFAQPGTGTLHRHYIKQYVDSHEVVKGKHRKKLHFFEFNDEARTMAVVYPLHDGSIVDMPTSGGKIKRFTRYALLKFRFGADSLQLTAFRFVRNAGTDETDRLLFIPFKDQTCGKGSYPGGRYMDLDMGDISNGLLLLDFNRAYNPYCAYADGYQCPVPPPENHLSVAIPAGEKKYTGKRLKRKDK